MRLNIKCSQIEFNEKKFEKKKKMKIRLSQTNNGKNLRKNIKMYAKNTKQKNKMFEKIERKRKGYQTNNQREIQIKYTLKFTNISNINAF